MLEGTCVALFAFDVGFQVDLAKAGSLLAGASPVGLKRAGRPSPGWFDFDPLPLGQVVESEPVDVGPLRSEPGIEIVMYDFGAVIASFRIPMRVETEQLPGLGELLLNNQILRRKAEEAVGRFLQGIEAAIERPCLRDVAEDYVIFAIEKWGDGVALESLVEACAQCFAQAVEGETGSLSPEQVRRTLEPRLSYGPNDLAIVDWNGALLFDAEPGDIVALLAHANVELLELRILDQELDKLLERADETLAKLSRRRAWPVLVEPRLLREFASVQTDAVVTFEGVNNAIKLLGNQYLARVYRLAAGRLDLPAWHSSVQRKLAATDSVYQKLSDAVSIRRMEVLEIIIIVLIAVSIVLPFLPFGKPY